MQMQTDFSFKMGPCHNTGPFLLKQSYILGLLFAFFILFMIVKLFEAIVRTWGIKVSDKTHKFVMLTVSRPNR